MDEKKVLWIIIFVLAIGLCYSFHSNSVTQNKLEAFAQGVQSSFEEVDKSLVDLEEVKSASVSTQSIQEYLLNVDKNIQNLDVRLSSLENTVKQGISDAKNFSTVNDMKTEKLINQQKELTNKLENQNSWRRRQHYQIMMQQMTRRNSVDKHHKDMRPE